MNDWFIGSIILNTVFGVSIVLLFIIAHAQNINLKLLREYIEEVEKNTWR